MTPDESKLSVSVAAPSPFFAAVFAGVMAGGLFLLPRLSASAPAFVLPMSIAGLFAALPLLVTRLAGRLIHALLALSTTILLISVIDSPDNAIGYLVLFGLWALVAGDVMARRKSVIAGGAAGLVVLALEAALATASEGTAPMEETLKSPQVQAALDQWAAQVPLQPAEAKETIDGVRSGILALYPSLCVISAAIIVSLNAVALGRMVGRWGVPGFLRGELMLLRWPLAFVLAFVGSGLLLLIPDLSVFGWNGLVVTLFLFLLQGLSVMTFGLTRLFSSELVRLLFVIGSLLGPWAILLSLIGLFDQWFDFRSRLVGSETPTAPSN